MRPWARCITNSTTGASSLSSSRSTARVLSTTSCSTQLLDNHPTNGRITAPNSGRSLRSNVLDQLHIPSGPKAGPPGVLVEIAEMPGADLGHRPPNKGGRTTFGPWPAGESVLPKFLQQSCCAGHAGRSKITATATGLQNRSGNRHAADESALFGGFGLMSMRRIAALQIGFLLAAMLANASPKSTLRITVLDSATRALASDTNGVPQNCEQLTFDAYCRSTTNVPLLSTLLVKEDNGPTYRISCTVESKYSRCVPLAKGESYDAKRAKHGLEVYYEDDKGKTRKQFYALVDTNGKAGPPVAAAAVSTQPVPAAAAAQQSSPSTSPAPATVVPQQVSPEKVSEKAKCNFSSTPAGAEITVDGKYLGSTPSEIPLSAGTHVVVFSMPGFAQWKRELTVLPGSELTVGAILQKEQP